VTDQNAADLISVPQGGGAISGIGETFQPDLHTGTGNLTIPLELPAGRNGLQPSLTLSYCTGSPNGPFGLGWALSAPGVRRKTDKGIPRYDPDLDTFVLSGAEDLVPVSGLGTDTVRYRPRSEAGFARITHLTAAGGDYWEVWSADGLRSRYGTPLPRNPPPRWADPAVIADPTQPERIFAWLLTETTDPLGNTISYAYQLDPAGTAQRYLSQISYADYGDPATPQYLVTVKIIPDPNPRPDPFSDHRPGFELRTTQRVAAIETWTQAATPVLARRVELSYADQTGTPAGNGVSLLTQITVTGVDGDSTQALPPLEFGYTPWDPAARHYQPLTVTASQLPPTSLAAPGLDLVDMLGDGLASILELNGTARYWRNRGNGIFDPPHSLTYAPAGVNLGDSGVQLADLDGDGRPDLLLSTSLRTGYWPLASNGGFDPAGYVPVSQAPTVSLSDPLVRLIDLDGDAKIDALRTGDQFELFYSDDGAAFNRIQTLPRGGDVPDVTFGDPRVFLADMTGTGLTDLVLVHDGNITYWPYQGYGSWGAKVVMKNAPQFPDAAAYPGTGFDPRRLLLGDIDGDGCADIVYVGDGTLSVWVNQVGNSFTDPVTIRGTPRVAGASIRLADMAGTGTAGVLWTYDLGSVRGSSYKFLDLTGGTKPYLLNRSDNHAGATTTITYAPSTAYAIVDRAAGRPWQTTLPFPVQVVASTSVTDYFSQNTLTSEYFYHHGYWDGADREFRGFARVDQRDTLTLTGPAPDYYSPPTETRTWFHLGPVGSESRWAADLDLSTDYWAGDPILTPHVDISGATNLQGRDLRYAVRALRGEVLRSELYALDGDPDASNPYQITDHAYALVYLQASDPQWRKSSPVVVVQPVLNRASAWERGTDPMTTATVTGGYDDYGRSHQTLQIAVPRGRNPHMTVPAGTSPYLATTTLTDYATRDDDTHYLINRVSLQQRLELTEDTTTTAGAALIAYAFQQLATPPTPTAENVRALSLTYYDGLAFDGLPTGQLGDWGLRARVETLALTPDILAAAYQGGDPSIPLPPYLEPGTPVWTSDYPPAFRDLTDSLAGYRYQPVQPPYLAGWYAQQERLAYDVQQQGSGRGLVTARLDPLGNKTTITYDDPYQLLLSTVTDAVGLPRSASYDYRALRPSVVTDTNGNRTQYNYTPLGLLASIAIMGKPGEGVGDEVPGESPVPSIQLSYAFMQATPAGQEVPLADIGQPMSVTTVRRVYHSSESDVPLPERDASITAVQYSDGFGRLLQTRTQAEDALFQDATYGDTGLPADQGVSPGEAVGKARSLAGPPNVVVSGWQMYDNKGRVVEKYEPFYSSDWDYEQPTALQNGQKVVMYYDPLGRIIRTVNPDGSQQRVICGVPGSIAAPDPASPDAYEPTPWETYTYDPNDNAGRTHPTVSAAYQSHWDTPASIMIDALGRTVASVARNGAKPVTDWFRTRATYDISGNLLTVTDALGRVTFRLVYDLANRPWRVESNDAGVCRTVLDAAGNAVEHRDGKGALILNAYDALNRPGFLWARDDDTSAVTLRERLEYGDGGDAGQPSGERQANRQANRLGKLAQHYDEAGLLTFVTFDFKGNVLEKERRVIIDSQLLSVYGPATNNDWQVQAFRIDWQPADGQTLDQLADMLLGPATAPSSYITTLSYDALSRVKTMTYPQDVTGGRKLLVPIYNEAGALEHVEVDGTAYVDHIAYNAKGQRTLIVYGNGVMTRYAYDFQTFRLLRMCTQGYSAPAALTYQPAGGLLQDLGYTYDLVSNVIDITDRAPGSGVVNNPEAAQITDPVLQTLVAAGDALPRFLTYDPLYRLRTATGRECSDIAVPRPWTDDPRCGRDTTSQSGPNQGASSLTSTYREEYTYDPVGNMLSLVHYIPDITLTDGWTRWFGMGGMTPAQWAQAWQSHLGSDWPAAPGNQLTHVGDNTNLVSPTHQFDAVGNLIRELLSRHFEWDQGNRMRVYRAQEGTVEPALHVQYCYDARGELVKSLARTQGGAYEVTVDIDGLFEDHRQVQGAATEENSTIHIMDGRRHISMLRAGTAFPADNSPQVTYHLGDHLGSINLVIDDTGAWVNREEYFPFGETSFGGFAGKCYRFTGQKHDDNSGLYDHGARRYAPWLARWISCDPIAAVTAIPGSNRYTYVMNNPLIYTDPTGLAPGDVLPGGGQSVITSGAELDYPFENRRPNFALGEAGTAAESQMIAAKWAFYEEGDRARSIMESPTWKEAFTHRSNQANAFIALFTATAWYVLERPGLWLSQGMSHVDTWADRLSGTSHTLDALASIPELGAAAEDALLLTRSYTAARLAVLSDRTAAWRGILVDTQGFKEAAGVIRGVRAMEKTGLWRLSAYQFHYEGAHGLDAVLRGVGDMEGFWASLEAKYSAGAKLDRYQLGNIRQGSEMYIGTRLATYVYRGGQNAATAEMLMGKLRGGWMESYFSAGGNLFKLQTSGKDISGKTLITPK
jgi:RHS repeat-associated protein